MIKIQFVCATCGKESGEHFLDKLSYPPFYNLDSELKRVIRKCHWIYQEDCAGDIYCSKKCAS